MDRFCLCKDTSIESEYSFEPNTQIEWLNELHLVDNPQSNQMEISRTNPAGPSAYQPLALEMFLSRFSHFLPEKISQWEVLTKNVILSSELKCKEQMTA